MGQWDWGGTAAGAAGGAAMGTSIMPGWGTVIGGAAGGILGGVGGLFGEDKDKQYAPAQTPVQFNKAPEYDESVGARETAWERLQQWGQQPGYGAIAPDWGDIWSRAKKKVQQYYWGGPGGEPGLADKVRSSAAQRGVSDSPALQTGLTQMGYSEGDKLQNMAIEQAVQEAQFGETGRQNWMGNVQNMANMRVPGQFSGGQNYNPYTTYAPKEDTTTSDLFSAVGDYAGSQGNKSWMEELMKKYGPQVAQTAITAGGNTAGGGGNMFASMYQ